MPGLALQQGQAGRVPRTPETRAPFPSPALREGAMKGTKNQGLFVWHFNIPPRFQVGRRRDA